MKNELFMTPGEYGEVTGFSKMTVNRMLNAGEIPAVKVRNRWLINRERALQELGIDRDEVSA